MPALINHAEAVAFFETIPDPVVQALIQHAHSLIFTDASAYFTTDFDVLLFYRVLEALFRDRKTLGEFLNSGIPDSRIAQPDSGQERGNGAENGGGTDTEV